MQGIAFDAIEKISKRLDEINPSPSLKYHIGSRIYSDFLIYGKNTWTIEGINDMAKEYFSQEKKLG